MSFKRKATRDLLVGTWKGVDEWSANVEYTIRRRDGVYSVTAVDTSDNEKADIYEEKWDKNKQILSFTGYWNSTGRFMRCRIHLTAKDKIEFTYTYTDTETMIRKVKPMVQRRGLSRSASRRKATSPAIGSRC
jgi:hypothetical protein